MLSLVTQACEPSGDNKVMGHCPDLPGLVRQIWSSARLVRQIWSSALSISAREQGNPTNIHTF